MLEKKNCNSSIFYSIWFYCKLGFNYNKKSLYFHVSLLQKKMNHEETVEKEVEELNYFQKFMKYISLSVNHHLNKCKNIFCCSVRAFISNLWHFYAENLLNGNVANLQKYCRVHHRIFFKLRAIFQSLAANEDFKNLLEQLNLLPPTKGNGVDFKKEMKKISELFCWKSFWQTGTAGWDTPSEDIFLGAVDYINFFF